MKHSNLLLSFAGFLAAIPIVRAGNHAEPFEVIAKANAFRLRAPAIEQKWPDPPINRPQITFQGFTALFGRAQVLLNIQLVGKAGTSCILAENENKEGVTIIEIDAKNETVRLNNSGLEQLLPFKR